MQQFAAEDGVVLGMAFQERRAGAPSRRRRRSRQHCQQLRNLLRVAGGVGRDAAAEAVDGRAKAMQIDVVDSRIVDVGWLCRNRSWIRHEEWLARG